MKTSNIILQIFFIQIILINIYTCQNNKTNIINKTQLSFDEEEVNNYINYKNILTYTDKNYTEIPKNQPIFLFVYSTMCTRCQDFMPIFVDTANYLIEKENSKIKFSKIDAVRNQQFSVTFNIDFIPTVLFFYKDKFYKYNGFRTKNGLLKYINKMYNGPITEITTIKQIEESHLKNKLVLLSTIKNKNSEMYISFKDLSEIFDKIDFLSCISQECIKKYGENDFILFKNFDEKINYYSKDYSNISKTTNETLYNFIGTFIYENGLLLREEQVNMLYDFNKKAILYFRNESDFEQTKYDKIFKEIGNKLRKYNTYSAILDVYGNDIFSQTAELLVVHYSDLPAIVYYDNDNTKEEFDTFRISNIKKEFLNVDYIVNYVKNIQSGKIKKDLRSALPFSKEAIEYIGAKIIIGRNYDEQVINEKNNIIIAFVNKVYTCELCDKYLDVFMTLGHKHKNETGDIIYAIMDGVANAARDIKYKFDDLPLIYLYTNAMKEKKVIKFVPKNQTEISEKEVVEFVGNNLGWSKEKINVHLNKSDPRKKEESKNKKDKKDDSSKSDL